MKRLSGLARKKALFSELIAVCMAGLFMALVFAARETEAVLEASRLDDAVLHAPVSVPRHIRYSDSRNALTEIRETFRRIELRDASCDYTDESTALPAVAVEFISVGETPDSLPCNRGFRRLSRAPPRFRGMNGRNLLSIG